MNQFNKKWSLDRQKFMSEAGVKKLKRVVEDMAIADQQKGEPPGLSIGWYMPTLQRKIYRIN